jgi:hypothetical protein
MPGFISKESGAEATNSTYLVPIDLGTAEILATTDQKPPSSKLGANG